MGTRDLAYKSAMNGPFAKCIQIALPPAYSTRAGCHNYTDQMTAALIVTFELLSTLRLVFSSVSGISR